MWEQRECEFSFRFGFRNGLCVRVIICMCNGQCRISYMGVVG